MCHEVGYFVTRRCLASYAKHFLGCWFIRQPRIEAWRNACIVAHVVLMLNDMTGIKPAEKGFSLPVIFYILGRNEKTRHWGSINKYVYMGVKF